MKKNSGFTMVEVLITIFLLAFVLLAMGTHIALAMRTSSNNKMLTIATQVMQDQVEQFKSMAYANVPNSCVANCTYTTANGAQYVKSWTVTTDGVNNVKTVTLNVAYLDKSLNGVLVISQ